jgi:hypothetical protein
MNEHDYAKPRHGYKLHTKNSDGSDPERDEANGIVTVAMNILAGGALFAFGVALVIFVIKMFGG